MLTIRLTRKGKKNQPFFRVVVIDKRRSSKGGRPSEILGYVDPLTKRKSLKKDRILHWISVGAQPSSTVHNLLVNEKIIEAKKMSKFNMSKKAAAAIKAKADAAAAPVAEVAPVAETSSSAEATDGQASPEATAPVEAPKEAEAPKPEEAPAA